MNLLEVVGGRRSVVVVGIVLASLFALPARHEERHRVVVTDTETTILDVVRFQPGTATLCHSSRPILDAVAATLIGNPSIQLVEVQAHMTGVGDAAADLALSEKRARAVVDYLVAAGVDPSRLTAQGYGDEQPIDRAAPDKNERISFLILKRSTDLEIAVTGATSP